MFFLICRTVMVPANTTDLEWTEMQCFSSEWNWKSSLTKTWTSRQRKQRVYTCTTRIPVYSTSCLHCTLYSLYSKVYCIVLHCRCYDDMFITCECRWTVDWQIITHHHDNCLDHSTSPRPPSCSACRSAPRSWSTPPASARAPRSQNTVNVISTILLANTSLLWRRCLSAAAAQSYTQPSTV